MDIMESFLGGAPQPGPSASPAGDLSSMGDIGSLLEAFLGGGQQMGIGANPLLAPFTEQLAEKPGISPQMASIITSFAFSLLISRMQSEAKPGTGGKSNENVFDLDGLLDDDYLDSQGITSQLSDQTGLGEDEAKQSLKEAVSLLSGHIESADLSDSNVRRIISFSTNCGFFENRKFTAHLFHNHPHRVCAGLKHPRPAW